MRNIIHFNTLANQVKAMNMNLFICLMTCIFTFGDVYLQAVERGAGPDGQKINYNIIKQRLGDLIYRLVYALFTMAFIGYLCLSKTC